MATHLHGRSLLSDIYATAAAPDDTGHHHARTGGRWLRSPGCNEYTNIAPATCQPARVSDCLRRHSTSTFALFLRAYRAARFT